MTEENKQEEPVQEESPVGEIKVPVVDLPSRAEVRSILKTGKTTGGVEVHPDSRKNLRRATIGDLLNFGAEVNRANQEIVNIIKNSLDSIDLNFKEVQWNFATFLSFLCEEGYLKEGALTRFEAFKKKTEEELIESSKVLLEKSEKKEEPKEPPKADY